MIPHLAWSVISTVKTNFIIWETRDWSWKPANFSTKPLAETQWKWADTFKSTEALQKREKMPPFSSYTFHIETVLRKHNGILNHQVSATFPNCRTPYFTLWHILYNLPSTLRNSVKHSDWSRHYFPLKWGGCLGLGCRIFLPVSDLTNSSLTSSANIAGGSLSQIIQLSCWETWRPGLIAIASLAVSRRKRTKLCVFKLTT